MSDPFWGLRCRPGDLAVIVQDEPECQANIGQLVRIIEVSYEFRDELGFHWKILPLSSQPSPVVVSSFSDKNCSRKVTWDTDSRVHLDAWLRPLLDTDEADETLEIAALPLESEFRDPVHLSMV